MRQVDIPADIGMIGSRRHDADRKFSSLSLFLEATYQYNAIDRNCLYFIENMYMYSHDIS